MDPISSLGELRSLARTDDGYAKLLFDTARNLGGRQTDDLNEAYAWLNSNAMEMEMQGEDGEQMVVDEVNFMLEI